MIESNLGIQWSSSDESVATVDEQGNVTVLREGEVIITATAGGASASMTVNGKSPEEEQPAGGQNTGDPGNGGSGDDGRPAETSGEDSEAGGQNYEIIKDPVQSEGQEGDVQNWRVYEMSETAEELAEVDSDSPLLPVIGWEMAGMLGAGFLLRIWKYRIDIR